MLEVATAGETLSLILAHLALFHVSIRDRSCLGSEAYSRDVVDVDLYSEDMMVGKKTLCAESK